MIGIDLLVLQTPNLDRQDLDRWILNAWVRPEREDGRYIFQDIDVARVRLIQELRHDMQVDEGALPVVLVLVDQLYDARRRMHDLGRALAVLAPEELRHRLLQHLKAPSSSADHLEGE